MQSASEAERALHRIRPLRQYPSPSPSSSSDDDFPMWVIGVAVGGVVANCDCRRVRETDRRTDTATMRCRRRVYCNLLVSGRGCSFCFKF